MESTREQIKKMNIYLVSFQRALEGLEEDEMSGKKFKSTFISIYDQFVRDNVQDPWTEFMRKEQLLKRIHSASCKRMGAFRSKSLPAGNRKEFHSALYFSIIELQNETWQLTAEKIKKLKRDRVKLIREFRFVSENYYKARELLLQRGADIHKYEFEFPI